MRGEAKRGTKKARGVLYRLTLKKDFQSKIEAFRDEFGVRKEGYRCFSEVNDSMLSPEREKNLLNYHMRKLELLTSLNIQPTELMDRALEDHIISNGKFELFRRFPSNGGASCTYGVPTAEEIKKVGQSFVTLRIYETASQDEVVEYVREKWGSIKRMHRAGSLSLGRSAQPRIRETKHPDRNRRIVELSRKPIKELHNLCQTPAGEKLHSKESLIAQIVEREGFAKPTSGAVKKIIQRYGKKSGDI